MPLFSERYGYVKPREAFIRECMPQEVQNAICTCLEHLRKNTLNFYQLIEKYIWVYYLNRKESDFPVYRPNVIISSIESDEFPWFQKLDIIEIILNGIEEEVRQRKLNSMIFKDFVEGLNFHFKRLYYGYRVVGKYISEITSDEGIATIERAIADNKDNIREHLNNALALLAKRPEADYRNSIKESISAVEAYCRELTGTDTLGKALSAIQKTSTPIPDVLKSAFVGLYTYTNSEETGIRHALMDDSGTYTPSLAEAQFMLVSCSAFLNYLKMKSV